MLPVDRDEHVLELDVAVRQPALVHVLQRVRQVREQLLAPHRQLLQLIVLLLKATTAFLWTTVIARFVQVYNNLDPDSRDFRMGWDALNRFISYFGVSKPDALELRRFYIERSELARSRARKQGRSRARK